MTDTNKIEVTGEQPLALAASDPMLSMIERVVMDENLPMERITALWDMRERQMNKEAEQSFNKAFAAAMAIMPDVKRTGKNKHLGNSYSTLDDLVRAIRPPLAAHGLSLNWETVTSEKNISVTAIVRHAHGHSIRTTLSGARDTGKQMNALQGGGSTETYLKRYSGFGILGLSSGDERDNDGNQQVAVKTITANQFVELQNLIEETNTNIDTFILAYGGIVGETTLEQFPAAQFENAKAKLLKKKEMAND